MELEEDRPNKKRSAHDVWEVHALRASLEDRTSPQDLFSKRLRQSPFVFVKTVSGTTLRVEPFSDQEDRLLYVGDIKRCLVEDHGMCLDNTVLLLNRQNISNVDNLEVESGSTIYAIFRVGGCHSSKPSYMDRSDF